MKGVYTMNRQKEHDIFRSLILSSGGQDIIEIINKLPKESRQIFGGVALGFAMAKGIEIDPPRPTAPAAVQTARAL